MPTATQPTEEGGLAQIKEAVKPYGDNVIVLAEEQSGAASKSDAAEVLNEVQAMLGKTPGISIKAVGRQIVIDGSLDQVDLNRIELVKKSYPDVLVLAQPTTGRRHQIRRHLKHLAHPIIGDATHGKGPLNRWWAERLGLQRLWLHAWRLQLPHPVDGRWITLDSGLRWPQATPGDGAAPWRDWQRVLALPWQND